jgi:uncharacterized protein
MRYVVKNKLILYIICFYFGSCATYTSITQDIRNSYRSSNYDAALSSLEDSSLKESSSDRLLYLLEKAMILDRMNRLEESRRLLLRADQVVDELYTVSISKTVATFLYNDSAADYSGEDFEKITIHTLLSLSFIQEKNYKSSLVQARKINNKLYEISQRLGDSHNSYREDAFALYLSGMSFEAMGGIDDAIIDYKKAYDLYKSSSYNKFYLGSPDKQVANALFRLAKQRRRSSLINLIKEKNPESANYSEQESAQIIVIHEVDNISLKRAQEFIIPVSNQIVRYSYPVIRYKPLYHSNLGFNIEGKEFVHAKNFSNLNAIAKHTLEEKRLRFMLKGGARVIAKAMLTNEVHEKLGPIAGILANVAAAATETADTRSWTLLPGGFYVSRVWLSPGEYNIGLNGSVQKIKLKDKQIVILRDRK